MRKGSTPPKVLPSSRPQKSGPQVRRRLLLPCPEELQCSPLEAQAGAAKAAGWVAAATAAGRGSAAVARAAGAAAARVVGDLAGAEAMGMGLEAGAVGKGADGTSGGWLCQRLKQLVDM